ncbi:unnamed protein product [Linum trigynum]|uniref:WPP domain-associated protein n=1 Tax=Linum trigynum TaxID=586398 RepID=A0AAV2ENB3_9ROSI
MDGIVGKVGGRFRISLTDSTMMKILHSAMDKSHERVKSEQGVILRLTEISKFYELAVMLLDGCLRFVGDEAVASSSSNNAAAEESGDEDVVGDLAEIRDRLRGRLRETELAIAEKDREFRCRFGDESPELKRLDSLGVDFRLEKLKSSSEGNSEEEFSELQHSVDQQVMNIKQKLGPEYKMVEKRRNKSVDCLRIDQMGSEIDILKSTMISRLGGCTVLCRCRNRRSKRSSEIDRRGKRGSIALNVGLMDVMNELRCLQDESISTRGKLREVLGKLENLIQWYGGHGNQEASLVKSLDEYDQERKPASMVDCLDGAFNEVNDTDASREVLVNEIEMLQMGMEDSCLQSSMTEKIYLAVIEGMLYDFRSRLYDSDIESRIKEEIVKDVVERTVYQWNQKLGNDRIEGEIREEVYQIVLSEVMKEIGSRLQFTLMESQDVVYECKLEGELREEMNEVLFRGTCRDWNDVVERHEAEEGLGQEVSLTVFGESLRDITETGNHMARNLKWAEYLYSSECIENAVMEDICMVFLRETCKSWQDEIDVHRYEDFLKEEIFRLLVTEVISEAYEIGKEGGCVSADGLNASAEFNVIQKPSSLDLIPVGHSKMKLQKDHLCIGGLQEGEANKQVISGKLLTEMKSNCSSVSSSVTRAIEHLAVTVELLQPEKSEEVKLTLSAAAIEQLISVSEVFTTFNCAVEARLGLNISRLQEATQRLSPLVEVVASMRSKESRYAEAFIRQSENLRRAEIEVDLLGDQVDALLGLLEKIYHILHQYPPILQQNSEVSDILMMIKRQLHN